MKTKHNFRILTGSLMALLATLFLSESRLYAQDDSQRDRQERQNRAAKIENEHESESDAASDHEKDWPHKLTLVAGGGLNYNWANGPYQLDQNSYDVGHGYGAEFHLGLEAPIGGSWMIAPRIDYSALPTTMTDGQLVTAGATPFPKLSTDMRTVGLDVLFKYSVNRVHFLLGPYISGIFKKTYAHGEFADADGSGTNLPGTHDLFVSAGAGIGYDAPLNSKNTMWLTPEIFYSYPLTHFGAGDLGDQTNNVSHLKTSTLRGAMSLKFDISPSEPPPPAPVPTAHPLSVRVTAKGVLPNGTASDDLELPEREVTTRASVPVLPYVFFDDNSSAIPARYSQSGSTGFSEDQLEGKDALEVNHDVLDLTGSRMKNHPDVTVTIVGTNCNTGSERHNESLSKERATAVKNYLVNTWGISPDRITVEARNLPELPTNPVTPAGIEENRRAEIRGESVEDPVNIVDKRAESAGETQIRYETVLENPDNIAVSNWRITLDQNGSQIGSAETGSGAPPSIINSKIVDADKYMSTPVHYTLEVTDANGKTYTADGTTHIEKATVADEKFFEKYTMLNFDFDTSAVNEHGEKMLKLTSESINNEALGVNVNGYCDITGTDEYNQALSERRANSAEGQLKDMANLPSTVSTEGHGRNDPKFPNDLPEGRQLNRRVEVEIQKSK